MKKRLSKLLAAAGVASRRACEELIFAGKVAVNCKVVRLPQTLVDPAIDRISHNGKVLRPEEKKVYFLLNKPAGYICTNVEKKLGAKRALDLFAHVPYRLFTAGRLDQQTAGLILVTNDGLFANWMVHPSYQISKEYLVKSDQEITFEHLQALSEGVWIDNTHVRPLSVKKVRKGTVKIVVGEGKKHEVRLLMAHAHLTVRELTRIRIGPFLLGSLAPGEYRELSHQEIHSINSFPNITPLPRIRN
jgi:23S rRNA pseudouridine2605 synthase